MRALEFIDSTIVITFILIILFIGIYTGKNIKTIKDYILYYKNYNPAILGMSLAMVIFGSGTIVGSINETYRIGIIYSLASMGYVVNSLISAKFIIPKFDQRFQSMVSVSDVFRYLYGKKAEKFSAITALVFDIGAASTQLLVIGNLLSYFFNVSKLLGLASTGIIMAIYSSMGGVRIVTILDAVKCVMLLIFIPVLANLITFNAGGVIPVLRNVPSYSLSVFDNPNFFEYFSLFLFFAIPVHMFQPIVVQRLVMIGDSKVSSNSIYIYGLIRTALIWMTTMVGLSLLVTMPSINHNDSLVTTLSTLPTGLKGMIIISILAIVMGKTDAHINSSGIIVTNNLLPKHIKLKYGELKSIRFVTLAVGIIAILISSLNLSVINVIVFIELFWSIFIGIPLIAGILRVNIKSKQFWTYCLIVLPIVLIIFLFTKFYHATVLSILIGIVVFTLLNLLSYREISNFENKFQLFSRVIQILPRISLFKEFKSFIIREKVNIGDNYFTFAIFFFITYTVPYFIWDYSGSNIVIYLRILSLLLCFILLIKNFWPPSCKKYFYIYWYLTLTITLPFTSAFMLLYTNWSESWLISTILSIFLLVLLTSWLAFIFITFLGIISAIGFYSVITGSVINVPDNHTIIFLAFYSFIYSIAIGGIFSRRKEEIFNQKIEIARIFGGTVAHEMRTFLLSMKNYINGLKDHLPVLIQNYEKTRNLKIGKKKINPHQLDILKKMNTNMERIIDKAFLFINLLLANIKGPDTQIDKEVSQIQECVEEAITCYPMSELEKFDLHTENIKNFTFIGSKEVMVHALFNLISNAIYFSSNNKKPRIDIYTGEDNRNNYFYFKDNGIGIAQYNVEKVFDKFFSKNKKGTGLGLSFCKLAMEMINGQIICESKQGVYTLFILKFPKINIKSKL